MTQLLPIPEIPEIPPELETAAKIGTLVPFIGAGVSRLVGSPSWDEFANEAIKFFVRKKKINLSRFEQIKHLNPRIKLSLALSMQKEFKISIDFESILHPKEYSQEKTIARLYGSLSTFSDRFVTTNYDNWLEKQYRADFNVNADAVINSTTLSARTKIYKRSEFTLNKLDNSGTVIHLHGCVDQPNSMILTTKNYAEHYANDRYNNIMDNNSENYVLTFLDNLFQGRSVIFIGYGLSELEILEYIIQKARVKNPSNEPKHFILQGFFGHELELVRAFKDYYKGLGIQLIPFSKDYNDHNQLLEIIEIFSNRIPIASTINAQKIQDMSERRINITPSERRSFIQNMSKNDVLSDNGFKTLVEEYSDFPLWFDDLKKAGLFNSNRDKGFSWETLHYLESVAKWTGDENNIDYANKILELVRTVSDVHKAGEYKGNFYTWYIFAKIFVLVPTKVLTDPDIDLIPAWINNDLQHQMVGNVLVTQLLPKLLDGNDADWKKACQILHHSLEIRRDPDKPGINTNEPTAAIGDYWLRELLNKNIESLSAKCPNEAANIFQNKLQEVFLKIEKTSPSWLKRPTIEKHTQNYEWYVVSNCLVEGLRDIVGSWLKTDQQEDAKKVIARLLKSDLEIERRIAIYLINNNFEKLKGFLSDTIPLLCESGHLHEMYELLENNFKNFDPDQQQQVMDTIKTLPEPSRGKSDIIKKRTQRNWLNAIKGKGSSEADKFFEDLNSDPELGKLFSHPSFLSWRESLVNPGHSPYQIPEILFFLDDGTLIKKLNDFEEQKNHFQHKPTTKALVDALEDAVSQEPQKFMVVLEDFQQAKKPYQYGIINGFKKLWDTADSKDIGQWKEIWEHLITFMEKILLNTTFWDELTEDRRDLTPNKDWIPPLVASFLRAAVNKDEKHIHSEFLPRVLGLIRELVENLQSRWIKNDRNAMTQAINSEKGKAIEALVDYALFTARLSDREHKEHQFAWQKVESIFTKQLALCKGDNFDFSTLMGAYFFNMEYLSPEWLEQHLMEIFPIEYVDNFSCSISGLSYAGSSKNGYILLSDAGIIQRALKNETDDGHVRKKLLQRIALAYIQEDESLNSQNFQLVLQSEGAADLKEIAGYFWALHNQNLEKEHIQRILTFWKECIEWVKRQEAIDGQLLSTMGLLISYLDSINSEQKEWLLMSAPHIAAHHQSNFFLEKLERLVDANTEAVKDIFLKMIETYTPFVDFNGQLESLIRKIHKGGFKNDALSVINSLIRIKGFPALYEELKG